MSDRQVYEKILAILENSTRKELYAGQYYNTETGCMCVVGEVAAACDALPAVKNENTTFLRAFYSRLTSVSAPKLLADFPMHNLSEVQMWNDNFNRHDNTQPSRKARYNEVVERLKKKIKSISR